MDTWIDCAWFKCRKRFEPGRRSNQFRHAGGAHHAGALYCSRSCQQKAYRHRRATGSATVTQEIADGRALSSEVLEGITAHATVTRPEEHVEKIGGFSSKDEHARPAFSPPPGAVLSDWRPRLPRDWKTLPDLPIPDLLRRTG